MAPSAALPYTAPPSPTPWSSVLLLVAPSASLPNTAPPSPAPRSSVLLLVAPSAALPNTALPSPASLSSVLPPPLSPVSPVSRSWRFLLCSPALLPLLLLSPPSDCCCPAAVVARVYGSPVLALPRLVPAVLSLKSPLARASRSPRSGPAIPCPWRWRTRRSRPRCQCHSLPRRCSSLRRPRVTLPQPSWRVSLFPSAVWNSPVVQKTDCRLQQRRCE